MVVNYGLVHPTIAMGVRTVPPDDPARSETSFSVAFLVFFVHI
jgi:hypothetical protein